MVPVWVLTELLLQRGPRPSLTGIREAAILKLQGEVDNIAIGSGNPRVHVAPALILRNFPILFQLMRPAAFVHLKGWRMPTLLSAPSRALRREAARSHLSEAATNGRCRITKFPITALVSPHPYSDPCPAYNRPSISQFWYSARHPSPQQVPFFV